MSSYQPSALEAFFVFNPTLGGELTEAKKILSFHPEDYNFESQKALVGLIEGLVNFTKDFSDKPADSLHTNKRRYAFLESEKDHFIVLAVQNPMVILPGSSSSNSKDRVRYMENELEDSVLQAIIKHAYTTFKFFNGSMNLIAKQRGNAILKRQIKLFMDYYIPTIRFSQLRFFTDINGFRFFPVDKTTYLAVQYLANLISTQFPRLQNLSAMYNSRLIWSGLEQEDMRVLYNLDQDNMNKGLYTYLAKCQLEEKVCPPHPQRQSSKSPLKEEPSSKSSRRRGRSSSSKKYSKGTFLTGPLRPGIHTNNCPSIYLSTNPNIPARLVVYRYQKLTLFWVYYDEKYDVAMENQRKRQQEEQGQPQQDESKNPENIESIEKPDKLQKSDHRRNSDLPSDQQKHENSENLPQQQGEHLDSANPPDQLKKSTDPPDKPQRSADSKPLPKSHKTDVKNLCERVEQFMLPKIKKLCLTLETQSQRLKEQEEPFRFLYFNHCNLALKTSLNSSGTPLSVETIQILRTIHVDFSKPTNNAREVCVKTAQDGWVVGRKSAESQREFYILVDERKAPTLPELKAEIDALETTYFSNIFIL